MQCWKAYQPGHTRMCQRAVPYWAGAGIGVLMYAAGILSGVLMFGLGLGTAARSAAAR